MKNLSSRLTHQHIEDYATMSAVCIRQLLNAKTIESLKQGIEYNLRSPSPRAKIASQADDPGFFIEDFCNWQTNSFYRELIFNSPLGAVAGALMKSSKVRLYHDHLLVKEARTRQHTPWHQDQPYYNIDGKQNCSFWIPVDPVSKYSTLEFVAGSHLGPWLMPRSFLSLQAQWFPEELPDIESARENYPILAWEMVPGDVICFHMLSLHASRGVEGSSRRRVFSVRFLGDDIMHAPRPWVTSPHFPGLEDELAAGAPMEHPLFPVVWER